MTWAFRQEEFLLTYQNQLDVIQGLKDKAWRVAHYSALVQAAVYALNETLNKPIDPLMTCLSLAGAVWAFWLVNNLQGGICVRRDRTSYLRTLENDAAVERTFNEVWKETYKIKPPQNLFKRWKADRPIGFAYLAAILVPTTVVLVSIWS
ncbi:MAG: hypothetical protein HOM25_00370 [Rhodospirillaceae bacterium]|jgi:hypothetical protein|nr:hypothetical protein [Rhodospirillaceae bacterium]MBT5667622.1 hypothetical protein [Rhodospirillaceae bacterium]MBT5808880.1 hypothetical protein [Rhodospirillaceae bacterium]